MEVTQMTGRAGRPCSGDTHGIAVIMTTTAMHQHYSNLASSMLPIESQLMKRLPESLCQEIEFGSVCDVFSAIAFAKNTYLSTRIIRNPHHYGIAVASAGLDPNGTLNTV